MQRSRLPVGGGNIFQKIRAKRSETAAQGMELFDLSIGEPKGPALMSARKAARNEKNDHHASLFYIASLSIQSRFC